MGLYLSSVCLSIIYLPTYHVSIIYHLSIHPSISLSLSIFYLNLYLSIIIIIYLSSIHTTEVVVRTKKSSCAKRLEQCLAHRNSLVMSARERLMPPLKPPLLPQPAFPLLYLRTRPVLLLHLYLLCLRSALSYERHETKSEV